MPPVITSALYVSVTKSPASIQQWSQMIFIQPFTVKVAIETLIVINIPCKCKLQAVFGFPKTMLICPSNVLISSFKPCLAKLVSWYIRFPKHQDGLFFTLKDTDLKDLPAGLNILPFRAVFCGIPPISSLNRLTSAHLKSRVCTLVIFFLTALRILNLAASWAVQQMLSMILTYQVFLGEWQIQHCVTLRCISVCKLFQKSTGLVLSLLGEVKEVKVFPKNQCLWYRGFLKLLWEDLTLFLTLVGGFVANTLPRPPFLASSLQGNEMCVRGEWGSLWKYPHLHPWLFRMQVGYKVAGYMNWWQEVMQRASKRHS